MEMYVEPPTLLFLLPYKWLSETFYSSGSNIVDSVYVIHNLS
jgi:hypothetical protein